MTGQHEEPGQQRADEAAEPEADEPQDSGEREPGAEEGEARAAESESRSGGGWSLKRLSGPQACLGIVGCGTLAAVLVVALVFGGIRLIAGVFTSGESEDSSAESASEWTPPESMDRGALDLCATLDTSGETGNLPEFGPERMDSGENYVDEEQDDGYRLISDDCDWNLLAEGWALHLQYEAYVTLREDVAPVDLASSTYDEWLQVAEAEIARPLEAESVDGRGSDIDIIFGLGDPGGEIIYSYLSRVNAAVFQVSITANGSESGAADQESDFRGIVHSLDPVLTTRIERILPS